MSKKAVFLDRDGTVIVDRHYLSDPAGVELEHHAAAGLRAMAAAGYALIVVSNQSGIARGCFRHDDAIAVNGRTDELLRRENVTILDWFFCPHGENDGCSCRKPRPGLVEAATRKYDLDLSQSWVIGDKRSDVDLAAAIGAFGMLVTTGHGAEYGEWAKAAGVPICSDLLAASQVMLGVSP